MRIMTPSAIHEKGLLNIIEASDDAPQEVTFCVPMPSYEASDIRSLSDFKNRFSQGISTKIIESGEKKLIYLDLDYSISNPGEFRFTTKIRNYNIDFYLSEANFDKLTPNVLQERTLDISHFYDGRRFASEFSSVKFLVLQPNWNQLDILFREERILFTDFK